MRSSAGVSENLRPLLRPQARAAASPAIVRSQVTVARKFCKTGENGEAKLTGGRRRVDQRATERSFEIFGSGIGGRIVDRQTAPLESLPYLV
jgi:hypothetical protein